jgi:hypothetical protein
VRVTLDNFKGHDTFDLRTWFTAPDGSRRPTRSGLTIGLKHLPAIAEAVAKALTEARARNLIPADTGGER